MSEISKNAHKLCMLPKIQKISGSQWIQIRSNEMKAWEGNKKGKANQGASSNYPTKQSNVFLWPAQKLCRKGLDGIFFTVLVSLFGAKSRIMEVYLKC